MVPMAPRKVKMRKITLEVMNKLDDAANSELSTFSATLWHRARS